MDKKLSNESIECSVSECVHHAEGKNYCTLNVVKIGTHENHPTECSCVDCESFCQSGKCGSAE